jgi:hypothetical protein
MRKKLVVHYLDKIMDEKNFYKLATNEHELGLDQKIT